jgi:hypothetical protein
VQAFPDAGRDIKAPSILEGVGLSAYMDYRLMAEGGHCEMPTKPHFGQKNRPHIEAWMILGDAIHVVV